MAPSRSRKQSTRQADYSNIGVAGRKTGVTLKDSGVRDEHGLEPIEGIFSSPGKPMSTHKIDGKNGAFVEEVDMSIGDSTVPEPIEVLSSRRVRLPPRSRSPLKTHLNASPRRSLGPQSSPLRVRSGSIGQDVPAFLNDNVRSMNSSSSPVTVAKSPINATSKVRIPRQVKTPPDIAYKKRKRLFDIGTTDTDDEDMDGAVGGPSMVENEMEPPEMAAEVHSHSEYHSGPAVTSHLEERHHSEARSTMSSTVNQSPQPSMQRRRVGRPKKYGGDNAEMLADSVTAGLADPLPQKNRRGRPPKKAKVSRAVESDLAESTAQKSEDERLKIQSRFGARSRGRRPPPSQRNPRARVTGGHSNASEANKLIEQAAPDRGKAKSRGLLLMRNETPADDSGAQILRSGRTSVKPMAFWRNERIVYDKSNVDGLRLPLQGIKEVIRTEEVSAPEKRYKKRSRKHLKYAVIDEDDNQDPWEVEDGIYGGSVMKWDSEAQKATDSDFELIDIAFAAKGLEQATRDVKGAKFQYGKTVTLPFFHSGVVDLPTQGEKRMKNSRKNHMVFWVFSGRVDVDVSGNNFSIGRGGMWQVPRGNFYSLSNPYPNPARVFFAQGCYMTEKEGLELSE